MKKRLRFLTFIGLVSIIASVPFIINFPIKLIYNTNGPSR